MFVLICGFQDRHKCVKTKSQSSSEIPKKSCCKYLLSYGYKKILEIFWSDESGSEAEKVSRSVHVCA